ncbi:cytochrome c [Altericroceibacterium spongiae]|uniref:Cytochrome c n=1 Tax=Altericroceibacterium spongiae TaxID=2320269 RepID=A0A420EJ28_9SPHN|nr:cytochrome c [Altericroceibacterium spongiae]RKF20653.1 cytochrome c [Altericroceibacterium spongiae]
MRVFGFLGLAAAALSLAACSGSGDDTTQTDGAKQGPPPMPEPITLSQRPDATGGEKLYVEKCMMCHGPNGMGTGLLARRMDVPLLEERDDLTVDYVTQAARMGIGNMPAIPRGEVSDEQLEQIAQYLASKNPDAGDGA